MRCASASRGRRIRAVLHQLRSARLTVERSRKERLINPIIYRADSRRQISRKLPRDLSRKLFVVAFPSRATRRRPLFERLDPRRLRVSARRRGPFQASSSSWRPRSRPGSRRSKCRRSASTRPATSLARVARKERLGGRPRVGDVDSFGRPCWDRTNDQRIMSPRAAPAVRVHC